MERKTETLHQERKRDLPVRGNTVITKTKKTQGETWSGVETLEGKTGLKELL